VIGEGKPQVIEVEAPSSNRGTLTLSLKLTPLRNAQGLTVGTALALDDLTALRQRDTTLDLVRTYLPPSLVSNIHDIEDPGLSGTERELSILIADVRGFTAFSELLSPEELMTTINRYLAVSTDALQLFDGIIDKYLGDAVIGLFNTPLNPQEDHAERAVRAALTMAYDVRALHEILPPEHRIGYGIGVATGAAIIGSLGSPDRRVFTALGPPVTLARLLQENALAGEIVISAATYEQVQPLFAAEPVPPRKRREGLVLPVMYRVSGVRRRD
jgi:adenylate cyclase